VGALGPLPQHVHDKASERGSCSVCYAWCLRALLIAMANPRANFVRPRVFDKESRTWKEPEP